MISDAGRAIPVAVPASFAAAGIAWLITDKLPGPDGLTALIALIIGAVVYAGLALGIGSALYVWLWRRSASLSPGSAGEMSRNETEGANGSESVAP